MQRKRKKRPVTLIEIMIVILLIGLIGGALTFNMRGSLDKGRVFKTEQNKARIYDAIMLEYAKGENTLEQLTKNPTEVLKNCPFIKEGEKLLKDGWGEPFSISVDGTDDVKIVSQKLDTWNQNHAFQPEKK